MTTVDYVPLLIFGISFFWILVQFFISFFDLKVSENFIRFNTGLYCIILILLNIFVFSDLILKGHSYTIELPDSLSIGGYKLTTNFYIDFFGSFFALLSAFLFTIIMKFSFSYLHKDPGFFRYFLLISILSLGIQFVCYAGSLDVLFTGWELVGITSVHLIAFFQYNTRSVQNSFKALIFYRTCDMALLAACVLLHYYDHGTEFSILRAHASENLSHWVGLFIILATLAKSAQFPLSNWLFQAMEGPTTSSAIYYGALSIHLGPFLLIRTQSVWMNYFPLKVLVFSIGFITALYASMVGKTRSDVKSTLAYSTITQVGIIYMELALGLTQFAMVHIACHTLLRTWQFLRSTSLFQDFLESSLTRDQFQIIVHDPVLKVSHWKKKLYVHALNGFYLDALQEFLFARPFKRMTQFLKSHELQICFLCGFFFLLSVLPFFKIDHHPLVWLTIGFSFVFSCIAFSSSFLSALTYVLISQFILCYAGFIVGDLGKVAAFTQCITLMIIAPILFYLASKIQHAIKGSKESYLGFFLIHPKTAITILILGWVLVGVPGGSIQVAEDILFYKLTELSPWTTLFFGLCSFANFLAFYSQYSKVFYGHPDKYKRALSMGFVSSARSSVREMSLMQQLFFGLIIVALFIFGTFPKLLILQ